jgi:DNA-directed RNA polymerase specialized sigma24 family protein
VAAFIAWIEENLGSRPEGLTIDRIDADGDYEPGNVRWATREVQAFNTRGRRADALERSLAERRSIARALAREGMTQREIADVLGASQQSVSNYLKVT